MITGNRLLLAIAAATVPSLAAGGGFTSADFPLFGPIEPNNVSHPMGYNVQSGNPANLTVNVCIVPGSTDAAALRVPIENVVDTFNNMVPVPVNIRTASSFSTAFDFESVALHEVGHCLGLNHPNAAGESPGTTEQRESTKAIPGSNGVLNYNTGADGLFGSPDDLRGDDVNIHYFEPGVNNPFRIMREVDATNYSIELADLPNGDSYAANAEREVGASARFNVAPDDCAGGFFAANQRCAEAVMQQGTSNAEIQRALGPDDVATLLYARSGVDRIAGTGDDYTPTLVYRGITASNCDINVSLNSAETGFGVCRTSFNSASANFNDAADAIAFIRSDAFFSETTNWEFSTVRIPMPAADGATVAPGETTVVSASVLANDVNQEGSGSLEVTTMSLGGPFAGTVDIESNGTFSYTNTDAGATSDLFVYEVCVAGTVACAHQIVELTIDADVLDLVFRDGFERR
ncbi:MAG: Ig-like domain-containing protein [Pseudomonadota bacterium]